MKIILSLRLLLLLSLALLLEVAPVGGASKLNTEKDATVAPARWGVVTHRSATGSIRYITLPGNRAITRNGPDLKHKIISRLISRKIIKLLRTRGEPTARQQRLGKLSLIFGAAAFGVALIPFVNVLSVPAAVTAIVLGIISLKGNSNTNGIIGLSLGGLFFVLLFLLIAILILAFGG